MRRWQLSKRDRRRLSEQLRELGFQLDEESRVEIVVEDDVEMIVVDGLASFIKMGDIYVPHLKLLLRRPGVVNVPVIVVDSGAVKPIARGADLMRPGIVSIRGSFEAGQLVVVAEPTRMLPLAVHKTLYSSSEIEAMQRGRVTKSLHHLGDRYWKLAGEWGLG